MPPRRLKQNWKIIIIIIIIKTVSRRVPTVGTCTLLYTYIIMYNNNIILHRCLHYNPQYRRRRHGELTRLCRPYTLQYTHTHHHIIIKCIIYMPITLLPSVYSSFTLYTYESVQHTGLFYFFHSFNSLVDNYYYYYYYYCRGEDDERRTYIIILSQSTPPPPPAGSLWWKN